jgi:hypothetical protein
MNKGKKEARRPNIHLRFKYYIIELEVGYNQKVNKNKCFTKEFSLRQKYIPHDINL